MPRPDDSPLSNYDLDEAIYNYGPPGPSWGIGIDLSEILSMEEETSAYHIGPIRARQIAAKLIACADWYEQNDASLTLNCPECGKPNSGLISPGRKFLIWGCRDHTPHAVSYGDSPGLATIPADQEGQHTDAEMQKRSASLLERYGTLTPWDAPA